MQRVDDDRQQAVHPGGVGLDDEDRAEPVDDEPGEPIRLGMDEAVIGRIVEPLAQLERAFEPAREKPLADFPGRVAVEHAGRNEGVRIEHRDTERAPSSRPAQGDEGPGRQRLRRRVHRDLVRVDPRMTGLAAAMGARQQGDLRPARRVVALDDIERLGDRRGIRHDPFSQIVIRGLAPGSAWMAGASPAMTGRESVSIQVKLALTYRQTNRSTTR